jgi:hypothetical protein
MSNELIIPNDEHGPEPLSVEDIQKYIDKLNTNSHKDGEWIYHDDLGFVWAPSSGDSMGQLPTPPVDKTPPKELIKLVEWGKQVDFDTMKPNTVVIIKLNTESPLHVQMMQRAIATQVLQPRVEQLKKNRICVLFMGSDDDITSLTEEDMNKAGWERKEKSLIILPH